MGDQLDFTISHLPKDIPPQLLQDRAGRCALDVADVVTEAGFLVGYINPGVNKERRVGEDET